MNKARTGGPHISKLGEASAAGPQGFATWPAWATVGSLLTIIAATASWDPTWTNPTTWALALVFMVSEATWLVQLGRAPLRSGAAPRLLRVSLILLVMAPPVVPALWIVAAIAIQGDNAWMGLIYALPGLVVGPFGVVAIARVLGRRPPTLG